MAIKTRSNHPAGMAFFFLLLACSVAVTVVTAAGPGNVSMGIIPEPDLNVTNHSLTDAGMTRDYAATPTPITIIRAEMTAETLPGPRYMAFGPSTIGIFIDPRVLAICFAIVLTGIVVWFVVLRKRRGNNEETAGESEKGEKE